MDFLKAYENILASNRDIALATSVDGQANVRIVTVCSDKIRKGVLYFSTFNDSNKINEFEKNSSVALTTIPYEDDQPYFRVHKATVKRSGFSIYDLKEQFTEKMPSYAEMIEQAGQFLVVYEILFTDVDITIDYETEGKISL